MLPIMFKMKTDVHVSLRVFQRSLLSAAIAAAAALPAFSFSTDALAAPPPRRSAPAAQRAPARTPPPASPMHLRTSGARGTSRARPATPPPAQPQQPPPPQPGYGHHAYRGTPGYGARHVAPPPRHSAPPRRVRAHFGRRIRHLPTGATLFTFNRANYYVLNGIYYLENGIGEWVISGAPLGYMVARLPIGFVTYYYHGMPYYFYAGTYYLWNDGAGYFEVIAPPEEVQRMADEDMAQAEAAGQVTEAVDEGTEAAPAQPASEPESALVAEPPSASAPAPVAAQKEEDKSEKDRRECHGWGIYESGINEAAPETATDAQREKYNKTLNGCLKARGWSIVDADK